MKGNVHKHSWFTAPLVLLAFLLLAYLPLASFYSALKNDAFLYNFPNKFFFSETLRSGILPTWNPYLNFGFPLYADPGFAWWHPATWLFGLIGYNAYTFTLEVLFFIYIAGCGMYRLAATLSLCQAAALVAGAMFMCCGFFIGNLQHINFLTCAAFLPWLLNYWLKLQQAPGLRTLLFAAIAGYLLCTGGHPAIPIGTVYFFGAFALAYHWYNRKNRNWKSLVRWNLAFCLLTLLFLLPPLWSWLKLMPFYTRNEMIAQAGQTHLGFTLPSLISFITPLPTAKAPFFFNTDVSMRNAYCSLPALLLFALAMRKKTRPPILKALVAAAIVGFVLSLGGSLKTIVFSHLPLLGYVRSNGQYRVFFLLPIILGAAYGLEGLLQQDAGFINALKKITWPLIWVAGFAALLCMVYAYTQNTYIEYAKAATLKQTLDSLQPEILLAVGMLWVSFVAAVLYTWTKAKKKAVMLLLILTDLFVNTWAMLPFTGVGKTSVHQMQQIYNHAPKGFPTPAEAKKNKYKPAKDERILIGDWQWFDKDPLKDSLINYPSALKHTQSNDSILQNPLLEFSYLRKHSGSSDITYFSPTKFRFKVSSAQNDSLLIHQNYYPGWHAMINGKRTLPVKSEKGFLLFPIKKGISRVDVMFSSF
jgi:hypothetical protein